MPLHPDARRLHLRRLCALALGAVLLAACGGAGEVDDAEAGPATDKLVRAAAATSLDAGSSKLSLVSNTKAGSQAVSFSGEGAYDYAAKTGSLSYAVPGPDGTPGAGGSIEQRVLGDVLYLSLPQQKGVFYKLKVSDVAGTSLGSSTDPTANLAVLQALTEVEKVGPKKVRGAPATHYRGTYDVSEAIDKAQGATKTVLETALRGVEAEQVPFDAYLDAEDRLVRLETRIEQPASAATGGAPLTSETVIELYDFGAEVTVEPPAASAVRDGAPLLAALRPKGPAATTAPTSATSPAPAAR